MAPMLAIVGNEIQNDWNMQLLLTEFVYDNVFRVTTGLAPSDVHMDRLYRLPLTVSKHSYDTDSPGLERDQLFCCRISRDPQQNSYELVRG